MKKKKQSHNDNINPFKLSWRLLWISRGMVVAAQGATDFPTFS
jgi:hypothetical protein